MASTPPKRPAASTRPTRSATQFIQNKATGKMVGSVGEGRDNVPGALPAVDTADTADTAASSTSPADALANLKGLSTDDKLAAAETALLAAIEQFSSEEGFKAALDFAAATPNYSMSNTMLLLLEHMRRIRTDPTIPTDPGAFMSFNSWKEHGRSVVKGAKGYPILAPATARVRFYKDASGRRITLGKGEDAPAGAKAETAEVVKGFTVVYTFAEYGTDGDPVPHLPRPVLLEGESLPGLRETAIELAQEAGFTVTFVNRAEDPTLRGGANGYTSYSDHRIVVAADLPSDFARDKTLLHELAHAKLHGPGGDGRSEHKGVIETQAESAAYLTFKALADMDTSDYSLPYVTGWMSVTGGDQKSRLKEAQRAINTTGKVAREIIDRYQARTQVDPIDELRAEPAFA
jgi:hypothetical protein